MTIHLPKEIESSVLAEVSSGNFPSIDDAIVEAWRSFIHNRKTSLDMPGIGSTDTRQRRAESPDQGVEHSVKPIWERILERTADIPDEEWDKLPVDLAEQHDHYLYGTPKRPTV